MDSNEVTLILLALAVSGFWLLVNVLARETWLKVISISGVLLFAIIATVKVALDLL